MCHSEAKHCTQALQIKRAWPAGGGQGVPYRPPPAPRNLPDAAEHPVCAARLLVSPVLVAAWWPAVSDDALTEQAREGIMALHAAGSACEFREHRAVTVS